MKAVSTWVLGLLLSCASLAQNPTYQQKLYYTCKVWGFVKYFHSGVSTCQVNWDSVLIARLPSIKNAVTTADFNNALDTLLNAAGPMTIVPGVLPDTIAPALKRNRNFGWINDPVFRSDVKVMLDTIKNNFRPHGGCWVTNNGWGNASNWLSFPHDNPIWSGSLYISLPDEWHRMLITCKYWNLLNYFNPYNYVQDIPWDSTLYHLLPSMTLAPDYDTFYQGFKKMVTSLNDAHPEGFTGASSDNIPNTDHAPSIQVKYISNKYIVTRSAVPGITIGDEIVTVDARTPVQLEDSLRSYISAGNTAVFHRLMGECLLCAYGYNSMLALTYLDSTGHLQSKTVVRDQTSNGSFFYPYYASLGCQYNYFPNDTLVAVPWKKWGCNIGYVNMGMMNMNDIRPMYSELQHTDAIIFDVRNYPISNADRSITSLMYSQDQCFANLTVPDTSYPGTFLPFLHDSAGNSGNASPYNGQAIILMDWETQSGAEWDCMMLSKLPHAIKVGSQTAGTDGNTTAFYLSTDIYTGFTAMGVYYCNGDSTERIGIVPDIVSYPTQQGVRQHRDEVLEKALQIANCPLGIKEIQKLVPEVSVYPNPSSGMIQVVGANLDPGKAVLKIMDLSGRKMQEINMETGPEGINKTIDVSGYKPGMYFLEVRTETKQMVVKVVKD